MKLYGVKVKNFRCYKDETYLQVDDLIVIVGKNDAGKSTLLEAMDAFFNKGISKEDACVFNQDKTVEISCIFSDLPEEITIDHSYSTSLESEHMLNQDGNLEIIKKYNCSNQKPSDTVYIRAYHPNLGGDSLLTMTITDLKRKATADQVDLSNVNQTVSAEIRQAIWLHHNSATKSIQDIELKRGDLDSIKTKLMSLLPVFTIFKSDRASTDQDKEAQDPLNLAIKEALKAQEAELERITDSVKQQVQIIADKTVEKIREMNIELANQLNPRVESKKWDTLFSVNITGDEDIPLNKRGSGVRRLVLLNFFRAKAEMDANDKDTGVIMAVEEPETSQHPSNQALLVKAFNELMAVHGNQVIITTHTPVLARKFSQDKLRFVVQNQKVSTVHNSLSDPLIKEMISSLGVFPDHNVKAFLGLEGPRDEDFIFNISDVLTNEMSLPNLRNAVNEGRLVIIPLGGSSLGVWINRLSGLNRPEFYIFDRDTNPPEDPHYKEEAEEINKNANCRAWITNKREAENYIHSSIIKQDLPHYQGIDDPFEDVPALVAEARANSNATSPWISLSERGKKRKIGEAKKLINQDYASRMTLKLLNQIDPNDEIIGWIKEIGAALND